MSFGGWCQVSTRVDKGLVEGFKLGSESLHPLNLQFVDDTLFFYLEEGFFTTLNGFFVFLRSIL